TESCVQHTPSMTDAPTALHHDPLSTGTLAELYVRQGFVQKALEIYRAILLENPLDRATEARVIELEALDSRPVESDLPIEDSSDLAADNKSAVSTLPDLFSPTADLVEFPEYASDPKVEELHTLKASTEYTSDTSQLPSQGVADNALATLDGWLENIRRIKSCR
ncbi:MAG: hypothetical protein PHI31_05360, partial [Desulfuromonadaceae bacterium]|nr:hypothetical protein [Desulfuromonadaceae bacterium]